MASRLCSGSARQESQLQFGDLPEDLQSRVLGALTLKDRWRYAACVCRRWRALCASAQLLRDVNVCVDFNRRYDAQPRLLPYMHSVFDWLHMHAAPHAQRLRLGFEGILGHSDDDDDDDDVGRPTLAEEKAAKALLTRALTGLLGAACASGRLQELTVELRWTSVPLGSWLLSAAGTLRGLHIYQNVDDLAVPAVAPALRRLTALQDLTLQAYDSAELKLEPGCRLPSQSLTSLCLGSAEYWMDSPHLPATLSELRELQRLELHGIYKAASCDVLARPPSLRCLRLQHCWAPPPSLSKLTALTALAIRQELIVHVFEDIPEEGFMAEWNQDKLQALADTRAFLASGCTQLRHLAALHLHFTADTLPITALPANLGACLPTLQRFAWTGSSEGLLPAGLTGLQQLVLPEALAQRSVAQLAAAAGLECLALCYPRLSSPEAQGEALHHQAAFAARLLPQLPSLRRLQLPGLSSCSQQRWDELGALLPSVTLSPFDRYQFEQWP